MKPWTRVLSALLLASIAFWPGESWAPSIINPGGGGSSASFTPPGTGTTTTTGQNWFLAQPPSFVPFVSGSNVSQYCSFIDDVNVVCFQATGANGVQQSRSSDGGKTWALGPAINSIFGASALEGVLPLPLPQGYAMVSGQIASSPFYTTPNGLEFVNRAVTSGLPLASPVGRMVGPNVNSILSPMSGTTPGLCRSTNAAVSWTCVASIPLPSGFTGTSPFFWVGSSGGGLAEDIQWAVPVQANIWLAIGQDAGNTLKIVRTTDDGVSWSQVFSDDAGGSIGGTGHAGVACFTSTTCVVARNQRIIRTTDGGLSWSVVNTVGPNGANTNWGGFAIFSTTVAAVIPHGSTATNGYSRSVDAGATWQSQASTTSCPQNNGVTRGLASVSVRNGRAITTSRYSALLSGSPCLNYAPISAGTTTIASPLGIPWNITVNGAGPVSQDEGLVDGTRTPWTMATSQRNTLFNSSTTGAANTAVVVTLAAAANTRARVYSVESFCAAAGTALLTITDGGTQIFTSTAAGIPTAPATLRREWPVGLTGSTNSAVVITAATCGVGNTTTLMVQADRY